MTIDEKLQHFMDVSVNGAYEKGQLMLKEYKTGMDKIYEEHTAAAINTANTYIKTSKSGIKRNMSKEFSKQQMDIRRELTDKQAEIKERIFKEVSELITDYRKNPEYITLLANYIKEAIEIASDCDMDIYIDPVDADKLDELTKLTGANINLNDKSFMGGMKAIIPSKNIIIDNSFESKFELAKENFMINL